MRCQKQLDPEEAVQLVSPSVLQELKRIDSAPIAIDRGATVR